MSRLELEREDIEERTRSLNLGKWNKPISRDFMVRTKKEQRRKEYGNFRILPFDNRINYYK